MAVHDSVPSTRRGAAGRTLREHGPALAIVAAFLALGTHYLLTTPSFEAPDEPAHYAYVRYLVEQRRLPPLVVSTDEWEQGEMHQPPLYYTLAALVAGGADEPGWREAWPRNPQAARGEPGAPGNRNAVLHGAQTARSERTAGALALVRAVSLACSAGTVWLTGLLAHTILPGRRAVALGAMGLLAANPQFLFIGSSASNDPLVTLLATGALVLAAGVARAEGADRHPVATPLAMGALAGLAALTKLSGLAALGLPPCAYILRYAGRPADGAARRRPWADLVRPVLLAVAAAAVAGGWWYARNGILFGDPLGTRSYNAIFVDAASLSLGQALQRAGEALPSYWGVFGWMNVLAPEAFYVLVRVLTGAGAAGLVVGLLNPSRRRALRHSPGWRAAILAALWIAATLAMLLGWTQSTAKTQGRLFFPGAAAISCFLAAGLACWAPRRGHGAVLALAVSLLAAAAVWMPSGVIAPAYALPERIAASALPEDVRPLAVQYGDGALTLLGYSVHVRDAAPGETLPITLYWQASRPLATNYVVAVQLTGSGGRRLGGIDTHPAMGRYPTSAWQLGEVVVDDVAVPVEEGEPAPVAATLRVALYDADPTATLPARDAQGQDLGSAPAIGRIRLAPREPAPSAPPSRALQARWAGAALRGYDLTTSGWPSGPDATLHLVLSWECEGEMSESYSVMVHLLAPDGEVLAYGDGLPMRGDLPTDYWRIGDRLRDVHDVALPAAPREGLRLRVGLYRLETLEPLSLDGEPAAAGMLILGPFDLNPDGTVVDRPPA